MLSIIYYAYIRPAGSWQDIIYHHIDVLKKCGLANKANIYIHISSENQERQDLCRNHVTSCLPEAKISCSTENQFEYPGISKVWDLSRENPSSEHYILYFHSKGMSHDNPVVRYDHVDKIIEHTIFPWERIIQIFKKNPDINKIGLTPDIEGWMWLNFWWARASYLSNCEKPVVTRLRHYYEYWLGVRSKESNQGMTHRDCYSLLTNKKGATYSAPTVRRLLDTIPLSRLCPNPYIASRESSTPTCRASSLRISRRRNMKSSRTIK